MAFKVLFIYPNLSMSSMVPHSIAVLSAVLKEKDIQTDVFDTTFYDTYTGDANEDKVRVFNVLPYNFSERGIRIKNTDVYADLRERINRFSPDLIAVSFVEDTFNFGKKLLKSIRDIDIPVVAGGVFCTYAPEKALVCQDIDYVIRGEGEKALQELCVSIRDGKSPLKVNNLCYRKDDGIVCNPVSRLNNFENLPFPIIQFLTNKIFIVL